MAGYIRELISIKKKAINNFIRQAGYLLPGRYHIDSSLTMIYHENDPEGYMKARSFLHTSSINLLLRCLLMILKVLCFRHQIHVESSSDQDGNEQGFCGTVCIIGIAKSSGKVFDFNSGRVLTYYADADEFSSVLTNHAYYSRYFLQPSVLYFSSQELITVEEYIESKHARLWTEDEFSAVARDVLSRYTAFLSSKIGNQCSEKIWVYDLVRDKARKYKINKLILSQIKPELLQTAFPCTRLHGDLWPSNILLKADSGEIRYIDFEMSDSYIFFYDILWFLCAYAFIDNDFFLLGKYLSGEYDGYLDACFKACGMEFIPEYRLDYINIAFLCYSARVWSIEGICIRLRAYNRYRRFLKKINTYMLGSSHG